MTTPTSDSVSAKGLLARAVGVVFAPRATYADIAVRPRPLPAILLVVVIIAAATFAFMSTEVGQNAAIDQQIDAMESFGVRVTDQMIDQIEARAGNGRYLAVVSQAVFIPLIVVIVAGLLLGIFNAVFSGDATFKQVLGVVSHSWLLPALQTPFVMPLNYARESLSSATSLNIFFPFIDGMSFLGMLLGSIDLFRIWWVVSLAIGLGVLYKRRTSPIAWGLLAVYAVLALAYAGVRAALSGA